jgi:hypothetical protein
MNEDLVIEPGQTNRCGRTRAPSYETVYLRAPRTVSKLRPGKVPVSFFNVRTMSLLLEWGREFPVSGNIPQLLDTIVNRFRPVRSVV